MRFGLTLPTGGPCADPTFLVELAQRAEHACWDGVFLEDYVVFQGDPAAPTCDPWIALAGIAVGTSQIRIGTRVTPLARRRPWNVARQAVAVDHLAGGRMILGAGLGDVDDHVGSDASFTHFGEQLDARRRARMLDEALEIIAGLWTGEPFAYEGECFTVSPVTFLPAPVQEPRIPIWIGGGYPLRGPSRRAARWDGAALYRADGGELAADDVAAIRSAAGERPYDITVGTREGGGDRERERLASLAEAGATWAVQYVPVSSPAMMRAAVDRPPPGADDGGA